MPKRYARELRRAPYSYKPGPLFGVKVTLTRRLPTSRSLRRSTGQPLAA